MNGAAINGLTALAAGALLLLAVLTTVLRGQAAAERYALARLAGEERDCRRQLRLLEWECARSFAEFVSEQPTPEGSKEQRP